MQVCEFAEESIFLVPGKKFHVWRLEWENGLETNNVFKHPNLFLRFVKYLLLNTVALKEILPVSNQVTLLDQRTMICGLKTGRASAPAVESTSPSTSPSAMEAGLYFTTQCCDSLAA